MTGAPRAFRKIGWQRLRLDVPESLRLATIDRNYLLFGEVSGRPALELKWAQAATKAQADPFYYLTKLSGSQRKGFEKLDVSPWTLPDAWQGVLSFFAVSGFSWRADGQEGKGLILCCPVCGTVTVIRFFPVSFLNTPDLIPQILASFVDHPDKEHILWAVFDIEAVLPASFALQFHRFDVGRFELRFSHGPHHLTLYRWAMAHVLLKGNPLENWPQNFGFPSQAQERRGQSGKGEYVEWMSSGRKSLLGLAGEYRLLRLMHIAHKDRVIGMELAIRYRWRKSPPGAFLANTPEDAMNTLWNGYGLV